MAMQLSFRSAPIDADEALRLCLANEVVAYDILLPRARQIAREILMAGGEMMQTVRRVIHSGFSLSSCIGRELERSGFGEFAEKNKPLNG